MCLQVVFVALSICALVLLPLAQLSVRDLFQNTMICHSDDMSSRAGYAKKKTRKEIDGDVSVVGFMYLVFARIQGESYR